MIWNLLERYTREDDLVVDPFCGGGTTLDVARDMGRKALGYEYCLECGENHAHEVSERMKKCTAPLYNKGAYQYVGSVQDARWAGR